MEEPARHEHVVVLLEGHVPQEGAQEALALVHEDQGVGVRVGEVDRVVPVGERHAEHHVAVEEQRQARVERRASASGQRLGLVVPLVEGSVHRLRQAEVMLDRRRQVLVGTPLVVADRVGALEAVLGDALLEAERTFGALEGDVVLARDVSEREPLDHARPTVFCSRSMLSKSARKLPPPKPLSPLRWMIS
jgi:hypothetical protein